jgi:GGDEF domain-containing protein
MVKLYKFDYLTGFKQRRDFEYETNHKLKNQEFYLTMYDVVGLHNVNREKGYEAGDSLIRAVANCIANTRGLWEVYRIGGDEFMALHFDTPEQCVNSVTMATVHSSQFTTLDEMITAVDKAVTAKKVALNRRRVD